MNSKILTLHYRFKNIEILKLTLKRVKINKPEIYKIFKNFNFKYLEVKNI